MSGTNDPKLFNNFAEASNTVQLSADLAIQKISGAGPFVPGQTINFTIMVTNLGPSYLVGNGKVTDLLTDDLLHTRWKCTASSGALCSNGASSLESTTQLSTTPALLRLSSSLSPLN